MKINKQARADAFMECSLMAKARAEDGDLDHEVNEALRQLSIEFKQRAELYRWSKLIVRKRK